MAVGTSQVREPAPSRQVRLWGTALWSESAPRKVVHAASWEDGTDGWKAWRKYLLKRDPLRSVANGVFRKAATLEWQLPSETESTTRDWLSELHRLARGKSATWHDPGQHLSQWIDSGTVWSVDQAFEAIACAQALPALVGSLPAALWWRLFNELAERSSQAQQRVVWSAALAEQLWQTELGLTLASLLPELQAATALAAQARDGLSNRLCQHIDEEGIPNPTIRRQLGALLASWTRSRQLLETTQPFNWGQDIQDRFEQLVQYALRTTRADGSLVWSSREPWPKALLESVLASTSPRPHRALAASVCHKRTRSAASKPVRATHKTSSSIESERSQTALMRTGWTPDAAYLAVTYHQPDIQIELATGPNLLATGNAVLEIWQDDQPIELVEVWEQVCWESNKRVDYLELVMEVAPGLRVERQFFMAREDRVAFLTESVLSHDTAEWRMRSSLPLAAGTRFESAAETTEGHLATKHRASLILPLSLAEWRIDARRGRFEASSDSITIDQRGQGQGVSTAWFIDLDPRRAAKSCTWRQLTVAEDRKPVTPDRAVAYRGQVGEEQWLFYRSLSGRSNRTVMGQNLITDFLAARFRRKGTTDVLLELEP